MTDATFEEGAERPLRLRAQGPDDLAVVAALLQDAVTRAGDLAWMRRRRRFALILNRFRWEDRAAAERAGRPFERVRSVALVENVTAVRASGVDPRDPELSLSLLDLVFDAAGDADDPSGTLRVVLAGDGEIAIDVEYLDMSVEDVTRPYVAPSGHAPSHPTD